MSDTKVAAKPYIIGSSATSFVVPSGLGLQTGLSVFWDFATTGWLDSTGNGNTLTATGTTPTIGTGPGTNACVTFNGTDNYLSRASTAFLQIGGVNFSINIWRKLVSGNPILIEKANSAAPPDIEYELSHFFGSGGFAGANIVSNAGFTGTALGGTNPVGSDTTNFHMVTVTCNSTTGEAILYFDAVVDLPTVTIPSLPVWSSTNTFWVGTRWDLPFVPLSVALLGVWKNRVLTPTEITTLYNSGSGLSYAAMA